MENYVISCCSTADLSKEHFDAIDVKYICFHFELDGKQYEDNLGVSIPFDEFYSRMANGADTKTSQVNAEEFEEYFRPFLEQGLDILHVSLSSGISGKGWLHKADSFICIITVFRSRLCPGDIQSALQ